LYKKIDQKGLEEGFSIEEIYEIANLVEISTTQSKIETTTIINTNVTKKSNNNEENKYFQRYFQHFQ
jgi:hypothetical protein